MFVMMYLFLNLGILGSIFDGIQRPLKVGNPLFSCSANKRFLTYFDKQ